MTDEQRQLWTKGTADTLMVMLDEALSRPPDERAFVAGLMIRYGLALHDSAQEAA